MPSETGDERSGTLQLSREEMRQLGYEVIDTLVDHFDNLPDKSVGQAPDRAELEARLREPIPDEGTDPLEVLQQAQNEVLPNTLRVDHPRFFGFVPSPNNFVGVMADALAAGFNVFSGTWVSGAGAAQVELVTIDWLRKECGLPEAAGGLFTSGGSMANVVALATARHVQLQDDMEKAVAYCSDQTHSSVARALRVLGFAPDQLRTLPSDDDFRLPVQTLREAVAQDRAQGLRPFCVVASAGTTNTGAVDPLAALAQFCQKEDLWLHVDGAYGAAAALSERGKAALDGLGAADSLSLDPHKWLFQPYEIGGVLVRDRRLLQQAFTMHAEYLEDAKATETEINFSNHGPQLTRSFRALKLWMTVKTFGRAQIAQAITNGFERAEQAEQLIRERPGWEIVTPAQMGIVTFRCVPEDLDPEATDALNQRLSQKLTQGGFAMMSSTSLKGQPVLRLCTINPRTTAADLQATIEQLEELQQAIAA